LPRCSKRHIKGGAFTDRASRSPERTTAITRMAVACEALYRVLRELPLQVGPGEPGGAAFFTRSGQVLRVQYRHRRKQVKARCWQFWSQASTSQINRLTVYGRSSVSALADVCLASA
jgi:hypothetical protein